MFSLFRKKDETDFSDYLPDDISTSKQKLLKICNKYKVPIYIDDNTETSSGVYSNLRAVASEAELERRLNIKKATIETKRANVMAFIALIVSLTALVKSFL